MRQCNPQHIILLGNWRPQGELGGSGFATLASRAGSAFPFLIGSATVLRQTTFRYLSHAPEECGFPQSAAQSQDLPLPEVGRSMRTELARMRN